MRRASVRAALALACVMSVGLPSQLAAQTVRDSAVASAATGTIRGVVRDVYGKPIPSVEVLAANGTIRGRTDVNGVFLLFRVPAGDVPMLVRRVGYLSSSRVVAVVADEVSTADWMVTAASTSLAPVQVTARQPYDSRLAGFRSRSEDKPSGYIITRARIEKSGNRNVVDLLRTVPGLRVSAPNRNGTTIRLRGRSCPPLLFMDGFAATATEFDFASIDLHMVEGIEVYASSASLPAEFFAPRGLEQCGVVAIWSQPSRAKSNQVITEAQSADEVESILARAGAYSPDQVQEVARIHGGLPSFLYPDSLWREGVSGDVTLEFVVDSEGMIVWKTMSVVASTHAAFSQAVQEALYRSRWRSARLDGRPVAQLVQYPVHFSRPSGASLGER